jgi:AcrR family transcriptional regulator
MSHLAVNRGPEGGPAQIRRERRRAEERLAILRAAAGVFRGHGYARAGMREIALAAGLSAANLYHYFASKDEILSFCQHRALDQLLSNLEAARRTRGPVGARLRELARAHVLCLIREVEGGSAHFEVDALPSGLREAVVAKRDRYELGVRGLVALGIRRGELWSGEPALAARGFLGAVNWTAHWFRPGGDLSAERVAQHVAEYAVAGLLARDGMGARRVRRTGAGAGRRTRPGAVAGRRGMRAREVEE